jgi:hypothetical protein
VQLKSESDGGTRRRLFYVPLQQGIHYGGLVDVVLTLMA